MATGNFALLNKKKKKKVFSTTAEKCGWASFGDIHEIKQKKNKQKNQTPFFFCPYSSPYQIEFQ